MDQTDQNSTGLRPEMPPPQDDEAKTPPSDIIELPAWEDDEESARIGIVDSSAGIGAEVDEDHMAAGDSVTAGDPDAMQEQAKVVGEEAVGGTTPTPDQNNVEDIAASVGMNPQPEHPINFVGQMYKRDEQRYELDPDSQGAGDSA